MVDYCVCGLFTCILVAKQVCLHVGLTFGLYLLMCDFVNCTSLVQYLHMCGLNRYTTAMCSVYW